MASEIDTAALCRVTGRPLDLYRGYNPETTICVLSGLSLPYTRLAAIKSQIIQERDSMKKIWVVKKQGLSLENVNLDFMGDGDKPVTPEETSAIVAKFRLK